MTKKETIEKMSSTIRDKALPKKERTSAVPKHQSADNLNAIMEYHNKAKKGKSKRALEGIEQTALLSQFSYFYPNAADLLIHIPNGGSRKNALEGALLKRQGVKAGVSDLFLALPAQIDGIVYHGFWLEFKATPPNDAAVSDKQLAWIAAVRKVGYMGEVGMGLDASIALLHTYMAGVKAFQNTHS
jgi:hypothetical protein